MIPLTWTAGGSVPEVGTGVSAEKSEPTLAGETGPWAYLVHAFRMARSLEADPQRGDRAGLLDQG